MIVMNGSSATAHGRHRRRHVDAMGASPSDLSVFTDSNREVHDVVTWMSANPLLAFALYRIPLGGIFAT
jgi:hypothetical protein